MLTEFDSSKPYDAKVSRTVLLGGKLVRAYLSNSQVSAQVERQSIGTDACPMLVSEK